MAILMTMQKIFQRIFSASPLAHNLMFDSTLAKTGFLNITTCKNKQRKISPYLFD